MLLDINKIITWCTTFYVFCSNFSLHGSLENAVSEQLEWLKFQNFSGGSAPKLLLMGLQHPSDPQLYWELPMAVQK